ncbi:MAG: hypothetical protein VX320_02385 [Candidatus Thermoplasmatota archaeon]|nr:hypothetical protein [Candidatus Thermoplasmatota archaeon]
MRKAMFLAALIFASLLPFEAATAHDSVSRNAQTIHLTSENPPGSIALFDSNGTLLTIDGSIPLDLSLAMDNWTLLRMIDGIPQVERLSFDNDTNASEFLEMNITSPVSVNGSAHLDVLGPIAQVTQLDATWQSSITIPNTLGHPNLPNPHLGIVAQLDQEFSGDLAAFESWLIANTEVGCCSYDRTAMSASNESVMLAAPTGDLNGSWGWSTTANLTGEGDGRSTRLFWVHITGDIMDETDLRITLPSPYEIRFSPQEEHISGLPDDFIVHRGDVTVTGNMTISIGTNAAPTAEVNAVDQNISYLPWSKASTINGVCEDSSITVPSPRFILQHGNTTLIDHELDTMVIDPMALGLEIGATVTLVFECTDSQGLKSNYTEDIYLDGIIPTRTLNMQYLHPDDESPVDVPYGQTEFSIPSQAVLSGSVLATDESGSTVQIIWTSNKTVGWTHNAVGTMAWSDVFYQGPHINGQHLSIEERHQPKPLTVYHLQLNLSDAAGNIKTQEWDVKITDRTAPYPRPALSVGGQYYGDLNHPIEGGENVDINLSQSWDDIDGITALTWEASLNGEPLDIGSSWAEVEHFTLPALPAGRHVLVVNATDSSGNQGTHASAFVVEPPIAPIYTVIDVIKVGGGGPGDPGALDVTIENAGQGFFQFRICYLDDCTVDLVGVQASPDGPAQMTHRLPVKEWGSGEVTIRIEIQNGTTIEHDTGINIEPEMAIIHWLLLLTPLLAGLGVLWYVGNKQRKEMEDSKPADKRR